MNQSIKPRGARLKVLELADISASPVASYPGLLTPVFVTCSTSNKRWSEKAWV